MHGVCVLLLLAFAEFFLILDREEYDVLAGVGAAALVGGFAVVALYEEEVAVVIGTVGMGVTGFAALVAVSEYIVGDALSESLIEDEVFADEFAFESFGFDLVGIVDDASKQLIHVLEAVVLEVGTGFLTAHSACAVQQ